MYDFDPVDGAGGAGVLKDRVDGAVVEGALVDGVVGLGVEKERGGDVTFGVVLGTEKERLPELKLFGAEKDRVFAMAGMVKSPSEKTTATTRARMRLTQVHGRMVPHPPG